MHESDPDHVALISAIEVRDFNKANEILARDSQNKYIHAVGPLQVTALQMAVWRGRIDLLEKLYQKGADVNFVDKIGRCALYYAAYKGNADVTEWLLQRGAYVDAKVGIHSCTIKIHPSVYPSSTTYFVGKNLPLPLCWERTSLHQAVKNNHADVVRILVKNGADVNAKDECQITPLLLAGSAVNRDNDQEMTKFVEIVKILTSANAFLNAIHPDTGTTVLHHAAQLGSATATEILLSNGAWPMFKCKSSGSTPLHIAASVGSTETLLVLIKAVQPYQIDTCDQINRTALHKASYQGHSECVRVLINHGSNLAAVTKTGITVVDAIIAHIPQPLVFLMDILDSCVQMTNNCPLNTPETITIDFSILAPKYQTQMAVVKAIIVATSGNIAQLAILQHPLVETFLRLKWARLKIFFFLLVFVHISFVTSLSSYAIKLIQDDRDYGLNRRILMICSCILLFHNTIQVLLEPRHYLKQYETWLSFISAVLCLVTSIANEINGCSKQEIMSHSHGHCAQWILHCISVAILIGWIQMMLLIGRFPMWGYYALMFSTVLQNILKVFLAFGYLIVGFALSFAVLFHGNDQFRDSWRALLRTMVMMMGEYEYTDLFTTQNGESTFLPVTSRIVFFIFVMLASMVLMNLMIGLAVNDIQGLEKEGHIRRLLKQAEFVAHLERLTSHRIFRNNWLHPRLRKLLYSTRDIPTKITLSYRENYSHHMSHNMEWSHKIPAELKEALFLLVTKTCFKNKNLAMNKNTEDVDMKFAAMLCQMEEQLRKWEARSRLNSMNRKLSKQRGCKRKLYKNMP